MLSRRGHSKAFFSGCHCVAVTGYCMQQTRVEPCAGMHQRRHDFQGNNMGQAQQPTCIHLKGALGTHFLNKSAALCTKSGACIGQ